MGLEFGKVNITDEQAQNFKRAAVTLTDTFVDLANPLKLPFMVIGMAQAAIVGGCGGLRIEGYKNIIAVPKKDAPGPPRPAKARNAQ